VNHRLTSSKANLASAQLKKERVSGSRLGKPSRSFNSLKNFSPRLWEREAAPAKSHPRLMIRSGG
jgi:hypothetical protein